jgi:septum formation protein
MKIVLASKSKVRKDILTEHNIDCEVIQSNVDEDPIKDSLIAEGATPVIDLNGELISKPSSREEAMNILRKLNGKSHYLISSVCISKNNSMIWNHTDKAKLTMKNFSEGELKDYLNKITDEALYAYNVYQIEGEGKNLFEKIEGDKDTIMGLPITQIKTYMENYK